MVTKSQLEKAIRFLKTIKEKNFIQFQQTLKFKRENVGKFHCVLGHLYVNPTSPFYKPELLNLGGVSTSECPLNNLRHTISLLSEINNDAPKGKIKQAVIDALQKELEYRFGEK